MTINRNTTPDQRAAYKTAEPATQAEMIRQALAKQSIEALNQILDNAINANAPAADIDMIRAEIAGRQ